MALLFVKFPCVEFFDGVSTYHVNGIIFFGINNKPCSIGWGFSIYSCKFFNLFLCVVVVRSVYGGN